MNLFQRSLAGFFGAILGLFCAFVLELTTGEGLHFIPLSLIVAPLAWGSAAGFFLGFVFYKLTGKLFSFLGRFGIESSP